MPKLLSHNDNPTETDAFGQSGFVNGIADVILFSVPPKGIAINGYWGAGKTSALKQLKRILGDQVVSVWFEAWRYQNEQLPIIALLHSIKEEFSLKRKLLNKTTKLGSVTFLGILGAFDEVVKAASGGFFQPKLGDLAKVGVDYEKEHYLSPLQTFELTKLLQDAIDAALGNKSDTKVEEKKKLVIFIDDLDRCGPDTALKLLEGIKVFLNLNNCVIVFAIDQRQIESALNKALNNKADEHYAREYLEKICQDIYHLPLPSSANKAQYFIGLVRQLLGSDPISVNRNDMRAHLAAIKAVLNEFDCLPANPRKIKALANRVAFVLRLKPSFSSTLVNSTAVSRDYCLMLSTAIIYTFHRELNEQLHRNPLLMSKVLSFSIDPDSIDRTVTTLMSGIQPSQNASEDLPVNPSDSNVFRLHKLFIALGAITEKEITPFLGL